MHCRLTILTVLLVTKLVVADPLDTPVQIHLAYGGDASSVRLTWITHASKAVANPVVVYSSAGVSPVTLPATTTTYNVGVGGWHGWIYLVTISGLEPATEYSYTCGDEKAGMSSTLKFTTASLPGPDTPVQFAVFGDMGTVIPDGWRVTQMIEDDNQDVDYDFVLCVGDLAYAGTGSTLEWEPVWDDFGRQLEPLSSTRPFMATVGNHEHYYNYTSFNTRYHMPGADTGGEGNFWYSFEVGGLHVTSMSSEHPYNAGTPQYAWLEQDLAGVNRSVTPWLVMTSHRPMYGSDEFEYTAHIPGAQLQMEIEPLLVQYKVDLMIYGHAHVYERMYPVIDGVPALTGTNYYRNPNAPSHVLQGTGGAYYPDKWTEPQPSWSAFRMGQNSTTFFPGYGQVSIVNATTLHYQYHLLETRDVADEFWIIKDE